jgi:hypothetical protein
VEGSITDKPGPYTIKLSYSRKLANYFPSPPVAAKEVIIFDDAGNSESLTQTSTGIFQTSYNGIKGTIGREYFVRIELSDGKIYESIPERMKPAGVIDSVYYKFKQYQPELETEKIKYQFRIFMDSYSETEKDSERFFLWKLTGTYRVQTKPELHILLNPGPAKDPRPCSGFVLDKKTGTIGYIAPCECCLCWADIVANKPNVSDSYIVANNKFNKVDMGLIPVEYWHFWDKTLVTVEQLSLSKIAFEYWKTIRDQKEGVTSLFQPAIGKARSNVFLKNGQEEVLGIFYAAGVAKKTFFLTAKDIPLGPRVIPPAPALPPRYVSLPGFELSEFDSPTEVVRESCLIAFPHSTTKQPIDWKD